MNIIPAIVRQYNFFGLEFEFNNVAFSLFGFEVYWYGIIIAVGFLLALFYGYKHAPRFGIDRDRMIDVVIVGLIGAIICARLYYIIGDGVPLSNYPSTKEKLDYILGIHNGGIGIYGGVIGAFLFGGLMSKLRKIKVLDMFDLAATGFLIGQMVGRIGNFVNQEVYGMPTGSDWFGIGGSRIGSELVHPLFLYESLWCLVCFIILHNIGKRRQFSGQLFLGYMILYSFGRYWLEGMRNTGFILMIFNMSQAQLVSIVAFVAAIILYIVLYRRSKLVDNSENYDDVFGAMCDDEEIVSAAYELLGCSDDCTDDEVDEAYNALKAKYEALIPEQSDDQDDENLSKSEQRKRAREKQKQEAERAEREQSILESDAPDADDEGMIEISEEELAVRATARLAELEKAYKYILGNRKLAAEERAKYDAVMQDAQPDTETEDLTEEDSENEID